MAWNFPQKTFLMETEDAAPYAIQCDWNDWRIHILHDAFETAPERQQLSDAGNLTFCENADDVPCADGVAGGFQRLDHFARTLRG